MVRPLPLSARFCAAAVLSAVVGTHCCSSPTICAGADDEKAVDRSRASDDPAEWIRQRRLLILDRAVVVMIGRDGWRFPEAAGPRGEPGYSELLYMPDWESEDNVTAFRVLTGEKLDRRLSEEDVKRVRALFPEARVRSLGEAYCEGLRSPCYCNRMVHRKLTIPQGPQLAPPR